MALPLAPVAFAAFKFGSVAVAAYALARSVQPMRVDQRVEDALDDTPEGLGARVPKDRKGQANAGARLKRVIRFGATGPGVEIDATALARVKIRKV